MGVFVCVSVAGVAISVVGAGTASAGTAGAADAAGELILLLPDVLAVCMYVCVWM